MKKMNRFSVSIKKDFTYEIHDVKITTRRMRDKTGKRVYKLHFDIPEDFHIKRYEAAPLEVNGNVPPNEEDEPNGNR